MRERATGRLCGQDVHLVGRDRHTVCICLIGADGWGLEDACSWDGWLWTVGSEIGGRMDRLKVRKGGWAMDDVGRDRNKKKEVEIIDLEGGGRPLT